MNASALSAHLIDQNSSQLQTPLKPEQALPEDLPPPETEAKDQVEAVLPSIHNSEQVNFVYIHIIYIYMVKIQYRQLKQR